MDILNNLVIKHHPSKYPSEANTPYVLWIVGNGRVGDKLSMGDGKTGKQCPIGISERFATIKEARVVYLKFVDYVEDMIKKKKTPEQSAKEDAEDSGPAQIGSKKKKKKKKHKGARASYHTWT